MRRVALACLALTAPLAVLEPRAAICAVIVSTALALVTRLEVAVGVCVVLLVAAPLGFRVDAAHRTASPAGHRR